MRYNFLQYKLYLIQQLSSKKLYKMAKMIFSNDFEAYAETNDAINRKIKSEIMSDMLAMPFIRNTLTTYLKMEFGQAELFLVAEKNPVIDKSVLLNVENNLNAFAKTDNSLNSATRSSIVSNLTVGIKRIGMLIRTLRSSSELLARLKADVATTESAGVKSSSKADLIACAEANNPIETKFKSEITSELFASLSTLEPKHVQIKSESNLFLFDLLFKNLLVNNTMFKINTSLEHRTIVDLLETKGDIISFKNALVMRGKASLFRETRLADLNFKTRKELNKRTLRSLKLTEI